MSFLKSHHGRYSGNHSLCLYKWHHSYMGVRGSHWCWLHSCNLYNLVYNCTLHFDLCLYKTVNWCTSWVPYRGLYQSHSDLLYSLAHSHTCSHSLHPHSYLHCGKGWIDIPSDYNHNYHQHNQVSSDIYNCLLHQYMYHGHKERLNTHQCWLHSENLGETNGKQFYLHNSIGNKLRYTRQLLCLIYLPWPMRYKTILLLENKKKREIWKKKLWLYVMTHTNQESHNLFYPAILHKPKQFFT